MQPREKLNESVVNNVFRTVLRIGSSQRHLTEQCGCEFYAMISATLLGAYRAGCGNLNMAVSQKAALMSEEKAWKNWSGNEQETPAEPLRDLQGEGGG